MPSNACLVHSSIAQALLCWLRPPEQYYLPCFSRGQNHSRYNDGRQDAKLLPIDIDNSLQYYILIHVAILICSPIKNFNDKTVFNKKTIINNKTVQSLLSNFKTNIIVVCL